MRAHVDDLAVFHGHDAVGQREGGQAVGDEDDGAVADEGLQRLLDRLLALQVDLAGGLIEDQDGGVAEIGAGQGDPLPLSAGEAPPSVPATVW